VARKGAEGLVRTEDLGDRSAVVESAPAGRVDVEAPVDDGDEIEVDLRAAIRSHWTRMNCWKLPRADDADK
jgi:hypothetical protein